jgi:hypothetical protein
MLFMAVDAVSVGIVSRKFPDNGKYAGKFLILEPPPRPLPVLPYCFY